MYSCQFLISRQITREEVEDSRSELTSCKENLELTRSALEEAENRESMVVQEVVIEFSKIQKAVVIRLFSPFGLLPGGQAPCLSFRAGRGILQVAKCSQ